MEVESSLISLCCCASLYCWSGSCDCSSCGSLLRCKLNHNDTLLSSHGPFTFTKLMLYIRKSDEKRSCHENGERNTRNFDVDWYCMIAGASASASVCRWFGCVRIGCSVRCHAFTLLLPSRHLPRRMKSRFHFYLRSFLSLLFDPLWSYFDAETPCVSRKNASTSSIPSPSTFFPGKADAASMARSDDTRS